MLDTDLPDLEQISMGDNALLGDSSAKRMTSTAYPFNYDNSLVLRIENGLRLLLIDLPSLISLKGLSNSLYYFGSVTMESTVAWDQ